MTISELRSNLLKQIPTLNASQLEAMHKVMEAITHTDQEEKSPKRQLGTMPDLVKFMADDFDEPLEDFNEYMQ